ITILTDLKLTQQYINGSEKIKKELQRHNREGAVLAKLGATIREKEEVKLIVEWISEDKQDRIFKEVDSETKEQQKKSNIRKEKAETNKDRGIIWEEGMQNRGWKKIWKISNKIKNIMAWLKLERNKQIQNTLTRQQIDWEATWERYKETLRNREEEGSSTRWLEKKIKRELPTLEKKKTRDQEGYDKYGKCIRCGEKKEDQIHVWQCRLVKQQISRLKQRIIEIMEQNIDDKLTTKKKSERKKEIQQVIEEENTKISWAWIIQGMVPKRWTRILKEINKQEAEEAIKEINRAIEQEAKKIWKKRNQVVG